MAPRYTGRAIIESPSPLRRIPTAKPGYGLVLRRDHAAVLESRTLFTKSVRFVEETERVLKSGEHQRKVGRQVRKGKWRGFPIYCLTLEERATCPSTCLHWRSCYGNNMHLAHRIHADDDFEAVLLLELAAYQAKHPRGFVVRLHILGDFYSVAYVRLWQRALRLFPALHVFGYTARQLSDPIGQLLERMSRRQWDRFAIRFSGRPGTRGATTYKLGEDAGGIICPAQHGKTDCCGTCGLCWQTQREISFEDHGDRSGKPRRELGDGGWRARRRSADVAIPLDVEG